MKTGRGKRKEGYDMSENTKKAPILDADIECTFTLRIRDDVFKPGRVRVHLPAPVNADWLYMGQVLASSPAFRMISIEDHPQRSVWFDEVLDENVDFTVTYAFESAPKTVTPDIEAINAAEQPGRAIDPAMIKKYEEGSHCDCTSYTGPFSDRVTVMDLVSESGIKVPKPGEAAKILGTSVEEIESAGPGNLIKKIFDLCATGNPGTVSFADASGSYESRNALLVALMRSCGVPARWQGGFKIVAAPVASVVPADWAIVNAAPYGWIYVDAQAAFEAREEGDEELAKFYFGGIDALRIPTASKIGAGLYPARDYKRADEKYNRYGEVEFEERGLEAGEFTTSITSSIV